MILGPRQEKWVQALESGDYEQCTNYLHRREPLGSLEPNAEFDECKDSYCCLGVACHLFKDECKLEVVEHDEVYVGYSEEEESLPLQVVDYLQFYGISGDYNSDDLPEELMKSEKHTEMIVNARNIDCIFEGPYLSTLNDEGWTFIQIAEFIRKYSEFIFRSPV